MRSRARYRLFGLRADGRQPGHESALAATSGLAVIYPKPKRPELLGCTEALAWCTGDAVRLKFEEIGSGYADVNGIQVNHQIYGQGEP